MVTSGHIVSVMQDAQKKAAAAKKRERKQTEDDKKSAKKPKKAKVRPYTLKYHMHP